MTNIFDTLIPSDHYGTLAEVLFPSETGLPVPILIHLRAEFEEPSFPIIKVKLTEIGNECDPDWVSVSIDTPPAFNSNELSDYIKHQINQFILINKDILENYWYNVPEILLQDVIIKI